MLLEVAFVLCCILDFFFKTTGKYNYLVDHFMFKTMEKALWL